MSKKSQNYEKDYSYPEPNDPDFLEKIYKKREFIYHRVPERAKMESYEDIQKYREQNCKVGEIVPREQQGIAPNFINPHTTYPGVILMHGTGSGKTGTAIRIAEQFKDQVKKYNTKIFVIVPGPNTSNNFKTEIINWTGETYIKNKNSLSQMTKAEKEREIKTALFAASQYYKIMSYKTFYRKVLGEKIIEKKLSNENTIKTSYKKTTEGDYERELVVDRINNMDNALLIVDEAHNLSGNEYGEALKNIIKKSQNLKVILLTATPMINLADEIVDLINFIRPQNDLIQRDKIFTSDKNYLMKLKPGGMEYLKEKAKGYISFYRGNIPYTFAKRVEKGEIPEGLLFTPLILCNMEKFQEEGYDKTKENLDDTLDRTSSAASNFVFPRLNKDKSNIEPCQSTEGLSVVLSQLNTDGPLLRKMINDKLFKGALPKEVENNFIIENNNNITGEILKLKYVHHFSIKFYKIIKRLNKLVTGQKNSSTAFIYSNLVRAGGIELFAETLKQNGYLEYMDDYKSYDIKEDTIHYRTCQTFAEYKKERLKNKNLEEFRPATFMLITGAADDTSGEDMSEAKQRIIKEVFNNIDNIDGKNIKLILGSRVMNEGVTLKNCSEVHILDAFYNLPKAEQVIGRAIRMCVHKESINDNNRFPKVRVYRYVVSKKSKNGNIDTSDIVLYRKAEEKYLLVKEVERGLKETAIDCPLLLHANMFPEEVEKYKGCVYPTLENVKNGKKICPALCDFKECTLKCTGVDKYYEKGKYKELTQKEIDYNTFNDELARFEIDNIKSKIKDLYRFKHVYLYEEMLEKIKKSFLPHQASLFDTYFLDQALEEMIPRSENEFNNYKDTVFDKYNRPGYLIQRNKYYLFQPFDENEEVPMYYRETMNINQDNNVSLKNYIEQQFGEIQATEEEVVEHKDNNKNVGYDFDSVMDYYTERDENFIVGIIDINPNNSNNVNDERDIFKIRPPLGRTVNMKRGTGIPTIKGSVCATSKEKEYLMKLISKMPAITNNVVKKFKKTTRENMCVELMNKLLFLEKYSTTKDKNKKTYIMIPADHPVYEFPFNLEDRIKHIINKTNKMSERTMDIMVRKIKGGKFLGDNFEDVSSYMLEIKNDKFADATKLKKLGYTLKKDLWEMLLE
jgi:hypothetical protein